MRITARLLAGMGLVVGACGDNSESSSTLVRIDDEPAGANCEFGGSAIHSGLDGDQDHVLDDNEISSSEYICLASTSVKCSDGDTVVTGTVTLRNDADFAALAGVSCIDGDLMIVGTELAQLPALPELATVTGSVIVAGNPSLESLAGLPGLRDVGRKFMVQGNDALTDLSALGALRAYQGLALVGNDSLTDLAGLAELTELAGGLLISNNGSLSSLHGLEGVTRGVRERITISSNRSLTSVEALSNLRSAVLIEFIGNPELAAIELASLERVEVYVNVASNASLTSAAFPSLATTGGLTVRSNPVLVDLDAPELTLSGTAVFDQNVSLSGLAFPQLSYITGDLDFSNQPQLAQIALPALTAVAGRLYFNQLPALASLEGFDTLSSVGGHFTLQACNLVPDFAGLGALVDVSNMTISRNAALTGFAGLDSFEKVGGDLTISMNSSLSVNVAQDFASSLVVGGVVNIN